MLIKVPALPVDEGFMRFIRWRWLILAVLVLVGASCGDPDIPDEGDVPQEAMVVMPGATVVESRLVTRRRRENVDGGVYPGGATKGVVYEIDGVTGRDVYEFYLNELSDKGWEFYAAIYSEDGISEVEGGGPRPVQSWRGGHCGTFKFWGPNEEYQERHIGVIHRMSLNLYYGTRDGGYPLGVEHIDDEIDGFRISIVLGFAPSVSCEDWDGVAWGACASQ